MPRLKDYPKWFDPYNKPYKPYGEPIPPEKTINETEKTIIGEIEQYSGYKIIAKESIASILEKHDDIDFFIECDYYDDYYITEEEGFKAVFGYCKYKIVENKNYDKQYKQYEKELQKYEKKHKEYKKRLKEWKVLNDKWREEEKEELKEKELKLLEKLKKKYE